MLNNEQKSKQARENILTMLRQESQKGLISHIRFTVLDPIPGPTQAQNLQMINLMLVVLDELYGAGAAVQGLAVFQDAVIQVGKKVAR